MSKYFSLKYLGLFLSIIIFFNLLCYCVFSKREAMANIIPKGKLEPTPDTPETANVTSEFPISELQCYLKQCEPTNPENWCNDQNQFIKSEWCNKQQDRCESNCNGVWVPSKNKKHDNKKNNKPNVTPAPDAEPPPPPRPIIKRVVKKIIKKEDRCSDLDGTCGGKNWFGPFCCNEGVCHKHDKFYSQCIMKNK